MSVSAAVVKELRDKTGAGMMDCKKALAETNGDLEKAIDFLRQKGLAAAAKKADRVAAEGVAAVVLSDAGTEGVVLELNCETDFVAKTDEYRQIAETLAKKALESKAASVDALLNTAAGDGKTVGDIVKEAVAKMGENIQVRRFERATGDVLAAYIHGGGKIGVLVSGKGPATDAARNALKDVAMQVAAARPLAVVREDIAQDVLIREKEIFSAQAAESGKPANIIEKMVEGRIQKFYAESCLVEQVYIKDPAGKQTVAAYLKSVDAGLAVTGFTRFEVGEGIQKKETDFAAEVQAQLA
ncbi:MAG: translation elongation factor Ts [Nitrospirota bacterium]|nr:translation elongation factor Ts [Nitrospirota bacterium]